jgi:diguanylate cyclase (GGDEF) domain
MTGGVKEVRSKGVRLFWVMLVIGILTLVFSSSQSYDFITYSDGSLIDYGHGWKTEAGKTVSLKGLSSAISGDDSNITISKQLPSYIKVGSSLNFRSKNIDFAVYVDGHEIYEFYPKVSKASGRSYGSCFHYIKIPSKYEGDTITIKADPIYNDGSCFLSMMKLGDNGQYFREFVRSHAIPFLVCMITIFLGMLMLILAFVVKNSELSGYNMFTLGILAIMIGTWSSMETLVPQALIGHSDVMHGINYLLLMLMPFPAVQFSNSLLAKPRKLYTQISITLVTIIFVVSSILNYSGIRDYHQCLPLIHAGLLFTVLFIVFMFVNNGIYCRRNKVKSMGFVMLAGFVICIIMGMMDLYRYVFSADASEDAGYFLRIGILMYVVILFANSFNQIMKRMRIASEAEIMRQVAYTDALTRLPNRTAFLDKEKELQDKVRSGAVSRVLVCQFDVNNLKIVNDTYGHAYGDRHLIAAAEAIREAFGESGQCYRVGGDEFTLFMTKEPLMENFESCIEKMKQNQEEYSKKPDTKLTLELAYGQAFYDGKEIDSIEKAEQIADSNMYGKKTEMKNINEE